jgi:uncharacterized protein (TIGR02284 family)
MATYDKKIEDLLQKLVKLNMDRIQGYEDAKEDTEDMNLIRLFDEYMTQSKRFKSELNSELINYGGEVPDESTFSSRMKNSWQYLKSAVKGQDTEAILNECEKGEDVIQEGYEEALSTDELVIPLELQNKLSAQYAELKTAHDQIRTLRNLASHS